MTDSHNTTGIVRDTKLEDGRPFRKYARTNGAGAGQFFQDSESSRLAQWQLAERRTVQQGMYRMQPLPFLTGNSFLTNMIFYLVVNRSKILFLCSSVTPTLYGSLHIWMVWRYSHSCHDCLHKPLIVRKRQLSLSSSFDNITYNLSILICF